MNKCNNCAKFLTCDRRKCNQVTFLQAGQEVVCGFTAGFIFISALIMFQFENQSFKNFFEAIYWSTTVLTTVGYGDICPKTEIGRLISIISSLVGIAFVALPTGIITSGFVEELNKEKENDEK